MGVASNLCSESISGGYLLRHHGHGRRIQPATQEDSSTLGAHAIRNGLPENGIEVFDVFLRLRIADAPVRGWGPIAFHLQAAGRNRERVGGRQALDIAKNSRGVIAV